MESDALVRRAARGDLDAFEALVQIHQHRIYALALRMTGSEEDAKDMAQEALLRIYRKLPDFRAEANFGTWVYRVTVNVCIDELRRRKRREQLSTEALSDSGLELSSREATPEEAVLQGEEGRQLQEAILRLPEDQRAAVVLRDVQGLSYEQVAESLQINVNTVKSRISRGRRRLREFLLCMRNNPAAPSSKEATNRQGPQRARSGTEQHNDRQEG